MITHVPDRATAHPLLDADAIVRSLAHIAYELTEQNDLLDGPISSASRSSVARREVRRQRRVDGLRAPGACRVGFGSAGAQRGRV
jgi:hypothetical protein